MNEAIEVLIAPADYLAALSANYIPALYRHRPQLVFYVAAADPYYQDQLGGLDLTIHGLLRRDELVIGEAHKASAAVAVVPAGGYAVKVTDTLAIHCNTVLAARAEPG